MDVQEDHVLNGDANSTERMFSIIKAAGSAKGPRLGRLQVRGRHLIETPHFLGITSRGVVPHITQDTFARDTGIPGVYVPLEDFIEKYPKKHPPVLAFQPPDGSSPLRRFTALPEQTLVVLGARRTPPVVAPAANSNTDSTVSVCTSVGFRQLDAEDYAEATEKLQPDAIVSLGDIPYGRALGAKRIEKATDRTIQWLQDHVAHRGGSSGSSASLFASLLPVSCANQQYLIEALTSGEAQEIDGLAFYDVAPLEDLPKDLAVLPRLGLTEPSTPHEILQHVVLGIDILAVPFVTAATDAGIALDFSFSASNPHLSNGKRMGLQALGVDMWSSDHTTDLSPLTTDCKCYACASHHRAYVQHLLNAKEMLAWVLLQIHNHHVLDLFFSGIRQSIRNDTFEEGIRRFTETYELRLPEKTGQGPRVRGYQFKSEGPGEAKKNSAAFNTLDDASEKLADSILPDASVDADDLQRQGFAERDD